MSLKKIDIKWCQLCYTFGGKVIIFHSCSALTDTLPSWMCQGPKNPKVERLMFLSVLSRSGKNKIRDSEEVVWKFQFTTYTNIANANKTNSAS